MSCVICNGDLSTGKTSVVGQIGLQTLKNASIHRQDNLVDVFNESIILHKFCRLYYTRRYQNKKGELKYRPLPRSKPKEVVDFEYIPITTCKTTCDNNSTVTPCNTENKYDLLLKTEETLGKTEYLPESNETYIPILAQAGTSNHSPDEIATLSEVKYSPGTDGTKIEYIPVSTDTGTIEEGIEPTLECLTSCPPADADEDDPAKPFPFQHKCFFCTKDIDFNKPVNRRNILYRVSETTQRTMYDRLSQTSALEGQAVFQRIKDINLLEVGAGYHHRCYQSILCIIHRHKLKMSQKANPEVTRNTELQAAFETIYRYIEEGNRTTFTLTELGRLCKEYQPDNRTLKFRLQKKYGEKIYFSSNLGRGTICTIIKDDSDVFSQLQTVNGIKLPQQCERSQIIQKKKENKKRSKVKKNKNTKSEEVRLDDKKEDRSKDINKQDDDDDDDDGFFADWLDPFPDEFTDEGHEESKENRNTLICRICLSSDRKLRALGDYRDIYRSMCVDTVQDTDSKQFLVCWECKALLRNVKQFQSKIQTAQKLWNDKKPLKCLSTLSIASPCSYVSYTPDSQNSEVYVEVEQFVKPNTEEIVIKLEYLEKLSPDHDTEESQEIQNNIDFNTFDNSRDDMDSDSSENTDRPKRQLLKGTTNEARKRSSEENGETEDMDGSRRKLHSRTTNEAKKRRSDENGEADDTDRPRRKLRSITTNEARKRSSSEENGEIDDEAMPSEKDSDTSSTENSDWEPSSKKIKTDKKKQTVQQKIKILYTIIDLNSDRKMKMKRIAIPPHELDHWRERERNSDYFESLKGNRCLRCLSEVTENHDEVFHSNSHPHICSVCESCFSTEEDLYAHIENHYYIYSCNICGYQCYNEQHMCDHADRHRTVVQCLECYAIKETLDILKEHYDEIHRYSQCDYCNKRFNHKIFLERHIQRNHLPLECTICHINFPTQKKKYRHMKMSHLIERTEAAYCVQCDIQFNDESLLKRHINNSTKHASEWTREPKKKQEKPKEQQAPKPKQKHKCPECSNVYSTKYSMNCHYDVVHKKKYNFYCKDCQKAFTKRPGYEKHIRVKHQGYKLPKNKFCHICGRGFSSNTILVHHIRTHTGERPHACALCAARFAQRVALTSHVRHVHQKMPRPTH